MGLTKQEALEMLESDDLVGIGMAAHQLRLKKNDPRVVTPDLQIGYYENLLRSLKARYPQVHLHCFSAPEILCIAEVSEISVRETIQRLMDAGLQSIPGGGAEILDDEVRAKIARLKCTSDDWEEMHRIAHSLGLRTTATMMFGCGEELRHRVNHKRWLSAVYTWTISTTSSPAGSLRALKSARSVCSSAPTMSAASS